MNSSTRTEHAAPPAQAEPVFLENTLLRVFGVLFCHDPKRARQRVGTLAVERGTKEKAIAVRIDPEYAQPGPFAHKVAMAIIRKHSNLGAPARSQVSFSQRELMRMTGRSSWGGRQSEQLALALRQIRYTHVIAHFKHEGRFVERDFNIFNEVILERRSSPADPIAACTVVLAEPIVRSLNDKHFTCLNHALLQQLSTIGQALYMRLFFHFSTQYDGHHLDRVMFKKRYEDVCSEWLGGLTVLKHRSKIIDEQLGVHLRQLVAAGFLSSYALSSSESGDGFVLTFRPGAAFKADYVRFYASRTASASFAFREEANDTGDAHRVAHLFTELRTGERARADAFVSTKDVETARELLKHVPLAEMGAFMRFAFAEAEKTRFDMQTLGALRQYIAPYKSRQTRQKARTRAEASIAAQEQDERLRLAYGQFRSQRAANVFAGLSSEARDEIEALAQAEISRLPNRGNGPLAQTVLAAARNRITAERYPEHIASFDRWKMSNAA